VQTVVENISRNGPLELQRSMESGCWIEGAANRLHLFPIEVMKTPSVQQTLSM
jgi:hypothetical protein